MQPAHGTSTSEFPGLKVIGAGWGRTGTKSLKLALERLGVGPCHHMSEVFRFDQSQLWLDLALGKPRAWAEVFAPPGGIPAGAPGGKGVVPSSHASGAYYQSCVDFPGSARYKELMQAFPEAKVILSVRDSADQWYTSASETIMKEHAFGRSFARQVHTLTDRKQWTGAQFVKYAVWEPVGLTEEVARDRAAACRAYEAWIEQVKQAVPPEKLLVFNVKQGWAPLCKFLGIPVPPEDFPRVNETKDILQFLEVGEKNSLRHLRKVIALAALATVSLGAIWRLATKRNR